MAPSSGGTACMLLVGDRVVLRSPSPPEAEYGLFEIADIELRASEPGRVREHGYQTTAERARARLMQSGITAALARECAHAMHPVLSEAYARGPAVRHVARYLGPTELFQSDAYDPSAQTYRGVFIDLPTLVRNLDVPNERPAATIQALFLAALLDAEAPDTTVFLSTDAWTKNKRPGERTHRRPQLGDPRKIVAALGELAALDPRPEIRDQLARADVLAFLRSRSDAAPDDDARALYQSLERAISVRDMPERGPLADADLWAIEMRLDTDQLEGIMAAVEEVERTRGRTPGTTYVRARASLALRLEPAKLVAERVSALALSMTSFQELSLLAAEAWLEAGDPRRAVPYARDLVDSPGIDEGLLLRAQRLLARSVGAAPEGQRTRTYADSIPAAPMPPSRPPPPVRPSAPPMSAPEVHAPQSFSPAQSRTPTARGAPSAPPPPSIEQEPVTPPAPVASAPPPRPRPAVADVVLPSARPPPLDLELTPPPMISGVAASFTVDLPGPDAPASGSPLPPPSSPPRSSPPRSAPPRSAPPRRPSAPLSAPRGAVVETRPPPSLDPRREPDSEPLLSISSPPPVSAHPTPLRPPPRSGEHPYLSGASLPFFRTESPAPLLPSAPLFPPSTGAADDVVEHLPLPPGIGREAMPADALPRSVLEARVAFTMLARELGLEYRLKRGIELRADESGIEGMQAALLESFPDHEVRTPAEAHEVRRHGALLGEILARRLGAEWLDITPRDLGHWAMIVPPDTRVWPFGRIARFIAMGHKERDLVSYFLELRSRASSR